MAAFFERLEARVRATDSLLCVGLDPHAADVGAADADAAFAFCERLVRATLDVAAAFKPNIAFFEALGPEGLVALRRVLDVIPAEIPVILDAKRGDIGTTSDAYATAAFSALRSDAVTVHAYMGADSVEPFLRDPTRGVFVLCKTSNPSSSEVQTLPLAAAVSIDDVHPRTVFEATALLARRWNRDSRHPNSVGLVVGATDVDALRAVRALTPELWMLAPGLGAQGGDLDRAVAAAVRPDGLGVLFPVSRGISRAADPAVAAREFRDALNRARAAASAASSSPSSTSSSSSASSSSSSSSPSSSSSSATAATPDVEDISPFRRSFLQAALDAGVLKFGSFTLKSGRLSPYFFNAGLFNTGRALGALGRCYAQAILDAELEFDVLFGPAYKGIPLVTTTATALAGLLADRADRARGAGGSGPSSVCPADVPVAYNRKEVKDHGEGGTLVGAALAGQRVLIVDDVISAGTAIGESVDLLLAAGARPVGVVIGLDRQERGRDEGSRLAATDEVAFKFGIPVVAVASLDDLLGFLRADLARAQAAHASSGSAGGAGAADAAPTSSASTVLEELARNLAAVEAYRAAYGAEKRKP